VPSRRLAALNPQGLSLEQSVSQFSNTMTAQADLRVEAAHLRRFLYNFRALSDSITAPRPVVSVWHRHTLALLHAALLS
jgi:predicted unusual protein kinase regulating ubiquinone biosynthesis (AarF/ABC1/UbiB family)